MKCAVIYSSLTGNTKMIAEAVLEVMPAGTKLYSVKEAPGADSFDFIALGYWANKGGPDKASMAYMETIRGKKTAIFATLGAYPDSDHAKRCLEKGAAILLPHNEVLGSFICQGKVDPKLLERMAKKPNNPHPMTAEREARLAEAARHPNAADCAAAKAAFAAIVARL